MATDIGTIDLEGAAQSGVWHKLVLPDGEVSDAEILLMGMDAPELEEVIGLLQQKEGRDMKMIDYMIKVVSVAAMDARNLENNGEVVTASQLPALFQKHKKWMVEQCFRVVMKRAEYLGNSSAN